MSLVINSIHRQLKVSYLNASSYHCSSSWEVSIITAPSIEEVPMDFVSGMLLEGGLRTIALRGSSYFRAML